MNYSAIFILLSVCLYCEANNNLVCKVYDSKTRTLENYCGGRLPADCSATALAVDDAVDNLIFRKCDSVQVLNTTKYYPNIHMLDVSHSGYNNIDWFNIPLLNLKIFNASHNEIENITNLLQNAPRVIDIDISFNRLRIVTNESFGTLNDLIDINLSNNWLQHINPDAFAKISTNLEHIDLSNNDIVGVPELTHCAKLRILHLEDNVIRNFTCQRIPWRDTLSAIYLSWRYVVRFDGSPEHCKQFRVIWDAESEGILRTANESIITYELHCNQHSFENLRSFRAGHNVFLNVDALIESFHSKLNELDVSGNAVTKLYPMDFKRFTDLRKLALSDTKLHTFDLDVFSGARYLQSLDISNNGLSYIHNLELLRTFSQLKELNCSGNHFSRDIMLKILNYMKLDVQLEVLDFSDSYVGALNPKLLEPKEGTNSSIKTLNLRNTNLSLDQNPFEKLYKLSTLDVSNNKLSEVNFRALSDTLIRLHNFEAANCELENPLSILQYFGHALKRINLSGNRISSGSFDQLTFQALTTLIHLNLSATDLREFDFKMIHQLEWLYTLDISNNHLQKLDLHELPHFIHLKRLYLNDNELKKLDRFKPGASPDVSLALAQNHLPCMYLKQLKYDSPNLKYIGHPLDQKHGENCLSGAQAIGDFLESVYETVKFW